MRESGSWCAVPQPRLATPTFQFSPVKLQRELDFARIVGFVTRTGDLREGTGRKEIEVARHGKLGRVRQVEKLGTKLHPGSLRGLEVFE